MHIVRTRFHLAWLLLLCVTGCAAPVPTLAPATGNAGPTRGHAEREFLDAIERAPDSRGATTQVIVVLGDDDAPPERARFVSIAVYEAPGPGPAFHRVLGPFPGTVGKNGFARWGEKHEGDCKSPTGRFTITELFGEDPAFKPRMPYRIVGDEDAWCEDPASPWYNQWLHGEAAKAATDRLKRDDDLYRHAAVIDYNRAPVVPGAGSAIFLHKADPDGAGTLGCVGLSAENLDTLLLRLDPSMHPEIIMGTPRELRRIHSP